MESTTTTLIIINLLLNFLQVLDHFLTKIKRSKCWGGELEMDKNIKDNKEKDLQIKYDNELIKKLEAFAISNQKQLDNKKDDKKDDPLNKL